MTIIIYNKTSQKVANVQCGTLEKDINSVFTGFLLRKNLTEDLYTFITLTTDVTQKVFHEKYSLVNGSIVDKLFSIEEKIEQQIITSKRYLINTDWYFARQSETGEAVPEDVITQRGESRTYLREQGL